MDSIIKEYALTAIIMTSYVYFTDMRCKPSQSMLDKLETLIEKAGIDRIDFKDKFVAVKIHFGEWGNLAFPRHQYAKIVCDHVRSRGGMPFLTDASTLYPGYRNQALKHLDSAYMNGFNPLSTGVHTIIADGLRGTDERIVPIRNGEILSEARIASAIAEADVIISITHVKGHMVAGLGGVLKNLGMGCGSKMGKMEMHSSGTPLIDSNKCIGCGMCVKFCDHRGVSIIDGKAVIDESSCKGCGHCFSYCPKGAIGCRYDEASAVMNKKVAEYAQAVVQDKPAFHISLAMNVSPNCDCDCGNDAPLVPDVGLFASFDPVALDQAAADAINDMPAIEDSLLGDCEHVCGNDVFRTIHSNTDWGSGLDHAEKIGLGTRKYDLIRI